MNILITGFGRGRLSTILSDRLQKAGHKVEWTGDIVGVNPEQIESKLSRCDIFIASAWNTKGNYKTDDIGNLTLAFCTRKWLTKCKAMKKHSIYFGCSDNSGFDDCYYKICKDSCDKLADWTIKIPYVWQPERKGSLPYLVENGLPYEIYDANVIYVSENDVIDTIMEHIHVISTLKMDISGFYENLHEEESFDHLEKRPISEWIKFYGKLDKKQK